MRIVLRLFFVLIIGFCFGAESFASEGFAQLYLLKKTDADTISGIMRDKLKADGYKVLGARNMYVVPENVDPMVPKYYVLLFKQNKNDCYYYNFTNVNYMLNDTLLEELEKKKIKYKKKNNKDLEELFEEAAIDLKSKAENFNLNYKYDFSDEAQKNFDKMYFGNVSIDEKKAGLLEQMKKVEEKDFSSLRTENGQVKIPEIQVKETSTKTKPLNGRVLTVPAGTAMNVKLQSDISTASLSTDDSLTATLLSDFIYDDVLIAPAGSILYGKALSAKKAGYAYGNASVEIAFNELLTPEGKSFRLSTESILLETDTNRAGKITRDVAVGTVVGVVGGLVGALLGLDLKNSILWGLSAGAASGTMHAVLQRGENVEIQSDQNLNIKLIEPMTVSE